MVVFKEIFINRILIFMIVGETSVFWSVREELSQTNRFRRSYYELLRDALDQFVLQYALIDSYHNFLKKKQPYPFVEKRELKPRARLPVNYALLIRRDPATREKKRYNFSHFHIQIDWPIEDAAEDLARSLRYISKDIDDKGGKDAEDVLKKYFEYYGMPFMVEGKSQDAIIYAQYLKKIPCITTIYVGSSEARALIRRMCQG